MLCSDAIPSRYAFTNPRLFKGEFEPRTVIAVDVAGLQLFGENNGVPQYARHVDLCIDHHAGNNGYADFTLLDAGAAAAAELLYQVIVEMGVTITPPHCRLPVHRRCHRHRLLQVLLHHCQHPHGGSKAY